MKTKNTIVAFDFDGTLTRSDTLLLFIRFAKGNMRFLWGFLLHMPLLVAYKIGLYPNDKAKQKIFEFFFKGISLEAFEELCEAFFEAYKDRIFRNDVPSCVRAYKQQGYELVIVSASIENWIRPFAALLGIDRIIATRIELDEKRCLTGRFASKNCYGKQKLVALLAAYPDRDAYDLIAYGDSKGDKALLDAADKAYYRYF